MEPSEGAGEGGIVVYTRNEFGERRLSIEIICNVISVVSTIAITASSRELSDARCEERLDENERCIINPIYSCPFESPLASICRTKSQLVV